jgi:hypothetical protein
VATAEEDCLSFSPSSRQSFRRTLADGISLAPLTLLAVPTFKFFSDVLHWRTHGHGWVTEQGFHELRDDRAFWIK